MSAKHGRNVRKNAGWAGRLQPRFFVMSGGNSWTGSQLRVLAHEKTACWTVLPSPDVCCSSRSASANCGSEGEVGGMTWPRMTCTHAASACHVKQPAAAAGSQAPAHPPPWCRPPHIRSGAAAPRARRAPRRAPCGRRTAPRPPAQGAGRAGAFSVWRRHHRGNACSFLATRDRAGQSTLSGCPPSPPARWANA